MGDSFDLYGLSLMALWLVLQLVALWMLRGRWRLAAWPSLIVMGLAFAIAALGVLEGSNMAPIWVILALPPCLTWIAGLWIVRAVAWIFGR